MPARGSTNHRDIAGRQFGELTAVACVGTVEHGRAKRKVSVWGLLCGLGHWDERSARSLWVTGDKTVCKECRRIRRGLPCPGVNGAMPQKVREA